MAFCKGCHEVFSEQILANYKMMERFDEGARFLEEFGLAEEDARSSRVSKRPSPCWRRSRGRFWVMGFYEGEPGAFSFIDTPLYFTWELQVPSCLCLLHYLDTFLVAVHSLKGQEPQIFLLRTNS